MKKLYTTLLLLSLICTGLFAQQKGSVEGIWLGTLKIQGTELRLGFTFTRDAAGTLAAVMNSLDQGRAEVTMEEASLSGDTLQVKNSAMAMQITGVVNLEKMTWETEFTQGPAKAPILFNKVEQMPD